MKYFVFGRESWLQINAVCDQDPYQTDLATAVNLCRDQRGLDYSAQVYAQT